MRPAEAVKLRYVNQFTHRTVRFASIKLHFSIKAHCLDNELRQLPNGKFLTRTDIYVAITYLTKRKNVMLNIKRTIEILKQKMFCVFLTQDCLLFWNAPINAQRIIKYADTRISLRMVKFIALILEYGRL